MVTPRYPACILFQQGRQPRNLRDGRRWDEPDENHQQCLDRFESFMVARTFRARAFHVPQRHDRPPHRPPRIIVGHAEAKGPAAGLEPRVCWRRGKLPLRALLLGIGLAVIAACTRAR